MAVPGESAPRVVLIAGEASGDQLGADLIRALRRERPELRIAGVAGPAMRAAGCEAWFDADELAVMGLFEVLRHLPRLLRVRRALLARLAADPPALLVGIDAPDFNLAVEARMRARGVPTAHYVSPSVWAWREGRVKLIRRAADLVLCLLPFETDFYARHGIAATFVGHPLAERIAGPPAPAPARDALGLAHDAPVLALLPGSRGGEVARLMPSFAATLAWLAERRPELQAVLPVAREKLAPAIRAALDAAGVAARTHLVTGDDAAARALAAADAALVTSGTATLEAALLGRPQVVAYRAAPLTLALVRALRLIRVTHFALPNLLASTPVIPEFLQGAVRPEAMGAALLELLDGGDARDRQLVEFANIHRTLRRDASATAARALLELIAPSVRA